MGILIYKRKLIKLGNHSRAIVLPINFLKKYSEEIEEVIIEEHPDKLIIKLKDKVNVE